ncbi:MAG: hypothetical protein MK085_13505, partial [Phycisphaerales bacterium]|nr:hypothetical protein [Phycisphaerales bacterium]
HDDFFFARNSLRGGASLGWGREDIGAVTARPSLGVHFEFLTNHDPRAVIGAVVADTGGVIRSLERRQPGLEEIFLELLRRADPNTESEFDA